MKEGAGEQSRCDDEHEGERHFGNEERLANLLPRVTGGSAVAALFKRFRKIAARGGNGRGKAEKDSDEQGDEQRKGKDAPVEADFAEPRNIRRAEFLYQA